MTFQINFDKEERSVSRIALIRQYSNDLKACDDEFDVDVFVRNEKKVHEYCRILRATRSAARGVAEQQQSQSHGSSSTITSAGGVYNRGPPSKKKNLKYYLRRL